MTRPVQSVVTSALWLSFLTAHLAIASNGTMYLYTGNNCADPNPILVPGLNDCICTPITNSFWSFKLGELDQGCTSTVYSRDNQYCGNSIKAGIYEVFLNQCVGNDTSINQFSIDCPSIVASPSSPASNSSSGISRSTQSGLATGLSIGSLILIAIAEFMCWSLRKKKRALQLQNSPTAPAAHTMTLEKEGAQLLEADGWKTELNTAYEMGDEKRQSRICELDGKWEGSEMHASSTIPTLVQDRIGSNRTESSVA